MRRTLTALTALSVAALATACAGADNNAIFTNGSAPWQTSGATAAAGEGAEGTQATLASGDIVDPAGKKVGSVGVAKGPHGLTLHVTATGLPPGFHGLHMHAVGKCEPNSADPANPGTTGNFLSSGGHLAGGGMDHPQHAGDLPSLYVLADGTGDLTTETDRLTEGNLDQAAGVSLIVHAGPDNYANIPSRYAPNGPDAETKKAGDAGARIACAVVKKS